MSTSDIPQWNSSSREGEWVVLDHPTAFLVSESESGIESQV